MLGLEHVTSRGSIMIEYYGRDIGVKIMPTGVNPDRFLEGFTWDDTLWRRGELLTQVCISPLSTCSSACWRGHCHAFSACQSQCCHEGFGLARVLLQAGSVAGS